MSTKKTSKKRGRKRRFEDSDDSDSNSVRTSPPPKKKRRRTLQLSQSDEETEKKIKRKTNTKRKSKQKSKVNRTPKPLKLTEAKPSEPIHYNNLSSPSPPQQISQNTSNTSNTNKKTTSMKKNSAKKKNSSKKKKKQTKSHDIRNFFSQQCSPTDYFSQFDNKPNYKNLKKQAAILKNVSNQHTNSNNKNKKKEKEIIAIVDESDDSYDVDLNTEDIEMKSVSESQQKKANANANANKPLKRPKKSPSPRKNKNINNNFAKLSCNTNTNTNTNTNNTQNKNININDTPITDSKNIPISNGHKKNNKNTKNNKQMTGRKRKLDEISKDSNNNNNNNNNTNTNNNNSNDDPNPAKKKKKFYPGFKRSDLPPMHGQTEIPTGKPYCLSSMRFVITGQLPSLTRDECKDIILQYGGRVTGSVSGMTRYLLAGEEAGESKTKKAKEKKVKIISEAKFLDLLRTLPKGKPPKLKPPKKPSKSKNSKLKNIAAQRGSRANDNNMLFVDKYAPLTSNELIGNPKCIKQLRQFLLSWDNIKNCSIRGKHGVKKGVLLSGQPGIGKTSAINVIGRELGYDLIEFNASDTRSKKSLKNVIEESLNNSRMTDYFSVNKNKNKNKNNKNKNNKNKPTTTTKKRNLIIMDEVDGMSSGDRGGMKQLIEYINKSKIPIICICNDRSSPKIRTLGGYCLDLRFRKPTTQQITNRLYNIANNEGFRCDIPSIQKIADGTNGDIRQMLHLLQFWSNDKNKILSYMDVKNKLSNMNKDLTIGPWDVAPKLFQPQTSILKGIEYYFVDYSLMPLMIQENYLNLNNYNRKYNAKQLCYLSYAAKSISDGDIMDHRIRKLQQYSSLPYHGILSSLKPGKYINYGQCGRLAQRIGFPTWFGKNSSTKKNQRLLSELAINIKSTNNAIVMDALPTLKEKIVNPLKGNGMGNIEDVIEFMKMYNISRNDWDTVCSLGDFRDKKVKSGKSDIVTKVKSAFTRKCNVMLGAKNVVKGKKGARATVNDLKIKNEGEDGEEEEGEESDTGDEDNDIAKDGLIKMKKGKNNGKKKTKKKTKTAANVKKRNRRKK